MHGLKWERKPHPPGRKPEVGEGKAPPGAGWGPANGEGEGRKRRAAGVGKEGGCPGLDTLRKREAGEGRSARSTRVDAGASQRGLGVQKILDQD